MIKNESIIERAVLDTLHKEVIARFLHLEAQQTEPLNTKSAKHSRRVMSRYSG